MKLGPYKRPAYFSSSFPSVGLKIAVCIFVTCKIWPRPVVLYLRMLGPLCWVVATLSLTSGSQFSGPQWLHARSLLQKLLNYGRDHISSITTAGSAGECQRLRVRRKPFLEKYLCFFFFVFVCLYILFGNVYTKTMELEFRDNGCHETALVYYKRETEIIYMMKDVRLSVEWAALWDAISIDFNLHIFQECHHL